MSEGKKYEFDAIIKKPENVESGFVEFPYEVEKEFGTKGQVKVKAYFDGYIYRGSLVKMKHHCHFIGLNKKVRDAIGKGPGDTVHVVIERDLEERTIEIPEYLAVLFKQNPEEKAFFESISFSHKRSYIEWITSAKKEETRISRIEKCLEMLKDKRKEP